MNKNKLFSKRNVKRIVYLFLGLLAFSCAFSFFLSPNHIVFGGVTGLSIVFKDVFDINPSLFVFFVSCGLLIISWFALGKEKTMGSILGSLLLPLFIELTDFISAFIVFEEVELLLSAIFGGVLAGIGLGLVYKAGFTTGGTDIINQIMNKYFKISIGKSMFLVDSLIVTSSIFVFGFRMFLYSIVALYLVTTITDRVILGVGQAKAFYIVTDKTSEVKKYIIDKLGHGVTIIDAVGGYTKENQKIIFCVVPTREYYFLKEGIDKIDNDSFFVVCDAYEVSGGE